MSGQGGRLIFQGSTEEGGLISLQIVSNSVNYAKAIAVKLWSVLPVHSIPEPVCKSGKREPKESTVVAAAGKKRKNGSDNNATALLSTGATEDDVASMLMQPFALQWFQRNLLSCEIDYLLHLHLHRRSSVSSLGQDQSSRLMRLNDFLAGGWPVLYETMKVLKQKGMKRNSQNIYQLAAMMSKQLVTFSSWETSKMVLSSTAGGVPAVGDFFLRFSSGNHSSVDGIVRIDYIAELKEGSHRCYRSVGSGRKKVKVNDGYDDDDDDHDHDHDSHHPVGICFRSYVANKETFKQKNFLKKIADGSSLMRWVRFTSESGNFVVVKTEKGSLLSQISQMATMAAASLGSSFDDGDAGSDEDSADDGENQCDEPVPEPF